MGVAVEIPQSISRVLISGEVKRLSYSRTRTLHTPGFCDGVQDKVGLNDGTEFHFGFSTQHSVRLDPRFAPESVRPRSLVSSFTGLLPTTCHAITDELLSVALSTGKRLNHYTGGSGSPSLRRLSGTSVQICLSYHHRSSLSSSSSDNRFTCVIAPLPAGSPPELIESWIGSKSGSCTGSAAARHSQLESVASTAA